MAVDPVFPDPASSIIVLRPGMAPLEVLMVERHHRGFFGGLAVFPGGKVDDVDRSDLARSVVAGSGADHEFRCAGLRELAEETGLAATTEGVVEAEAARDADVYRDLEERGLTFDGESLVLVSRWVTPEMAPRRFDTMFYLLAAESTPDVRIDTDELTGFAWVTPAEALRRSDSGEWTMMLPTLAHLRWLTRRSSIADAVASARGADGRTSIEPRRLDDGSLVPIHVPAELP